MNVAVRIWAKGWPVPLAYEVLQKAYHPSHSLPLFPEFSEAAPVGNPSPSRFSFKWVAITAALLLVGGGVYWYFTPQQLMRPEGLPLPAYREIRQAFKNPAQAGPVQILGVSGDYRRVWLADRDGQRCTYGLTLNSAATDNLSGDVVNLHAEATSESHWVVFDRWEYQAGLRLWPGKYQAVVNRIDCASTVVWQDAAADKEFSFTVEVFAGTKRDLEVGLTGLRSKKKKEQQRARQALVLGWRDVEEKCRTLSAIAVQIQQSFALLLDRKVPWRSRVTRVVDRYTLRFGGFLTNFTIRNEEDFNRIAREEVLEKVKLMSKGPIITGHAKRIGFVSMELIEWLQQGVPKREVLEARLQQLQTALEGVRRELDAEAASAQAVYTDVKPSSEVRKALPATETSP